MPCRAMLATASSHVPPLQVTVVSAEVQAEMKALRTALTEHTNLAKQLALEFKKLEAAQDDARKRFHNELSPTLEPRSRHGLLQIRVTVSGQGPRPFNFKSRNWMRIDGRVV